MVIKLKSKVFKLNTVRVRVYKRYPIYKGINKLKGLIQSSLVRKSNCKHESNNKNVKSLMVQCSIVQRVQSPLVQRIQSPMFRKVQSPNNTCPYSKVGAQRCSTWFKNSGCRTRSSRPKIDWGLDRIMDRRSTFRSFGPKSIQSQTIPNFFLKNHNILIMFFTKSLNEKHQFYVC